MDYIQAIILGIIEGLTEFLPVSSTGHLIIGSSLLGIDPNDQFVQLFNVAIQLGTILSVVVLYFKRFFKSLDFYYKLFVAFIPAVVLGLLFNKQIEAFLGNVTIVAVCLLLGGIVLLFVDKLFKNPKLDNADQVPYPSAFKIGIWQCLAMIPGVSRSAASIIGGMQQKMTKKAAAEFSFFLAVPTMFGATAKKLFDFYKQGLQVSAHEWGLLGVGNLVGFIVAIIAIKSFIGFVTKHGFKAFGVYRIIVGLIILALIYSGHGLQMV
ncbi:undecaprenyl-diphosphate phosphatase [Arachidicoccus ginsenosidivorans]|jgi:undecaprenyl-diphosphatase|uniref:Undecaprenyl-diphosphatase n=1 Tax=Arachidicoccus ginsenosidivorans TaxID=496057 RepID=A0A5B8VQC0_9BACT|nr:undecaprenyl-diphosphate phosphatase [Arachidicoccus ginsenosidivorans]QEC72896.1 undecaprenyl-diphosphate phosphatase [Arachidicoccus ginsenosidivorans]